MAPAMALRTEKRTLMSSCGVETCARQSDTDARRATCNLAVLDHDGCL